jgi:pyruvate dehydrogenase E2 component (dihydrolipoamide acetyltransferase)
MPIELTMPALSPTMEKGTLAKWLVKEGDTVKSGDLIAEIETDKATMELEAHEDGRIGRLLIAEGTADVAVGVALATLADLDEANAVPDAAPKAVEQNSTADVAIATPGAPVALPLVAKSPAKPLDSRASLFDRTLASPLAHRIAHAGGNDLKALRGSGPNGRIMRADLGLPDLARGAPQASVGIMPTPDFTAQLPPADVPVETAKLSTMRRTIARRLSEAKQQVPHFYLTIRCDIDPLLRLRTEINAAISARGVKISVNDMMMKAMALALIDVPNANVQFGGDVLHHFSRVDISMAVAIDGGLVTPLIRNADTLSLSAIASESKRLAAKAREGKLLPEEYEGGTASISNLGMYGIDEMVPVINIPQALILGVGAGIEQPWKVDGQIALATIAALTASFDHRAIDGAAAAQFMTSLRNYIEMPMRMTT